MRLTDEEMKQFLKWNYNISDEKADDLIIFINAYVNVSLDDCPSAQPERLSDDRKMIDTSPCDCSYCQYVRRIKEGKGQE